MTLVGSGGVAVVVEQAATVANNPSESSANKNLLKDEENRFRFCCLEFKLSDFPLEIAT